MIRKTLIASAVILCGTVGFSAAAKAQTATTTVDATGTVDALCTFGAVTPGVLELDTQATTLETTTTAGSVSVTCNTTTAQLTVSSITDDNANTITGYDVNNVDVAFTVSGASGGDISAVSTPQTLDLGTTPLSINLTASSNNGVVLPAGNYTYTLALEAAPN